MLYSKILIAYDGSKTSDKAFDSALKLAKLNHFSKLEIINVINEPSYLAGTMYFTPLLTSQEEYALYSAEVTNKIKEMISDFSNTHIEIRQGNPAKTILDYAEETKADLIVIGSRGLNSFGEFVLGSVSHNVMQHAKIPVLVIK
jgi:nucleotide-binding universal stress UspA family protein